MDNDCDEFMSDDTLRFLDRALTAGGNLFAVARIDGALMHLNSRGRELLGWQQDDLSSKELSNLLPGWALRIVEENGIPAALEAGTWEGTGAILTSSGSELHVALAILAHHSPDGVPQSIALVARDIDDEKARESEERYRYLSAMTKEGVCIHRLGVVLDANQAFCEIFGYDLDQLLGTDPVDLLFTKESVPELRAHHASGEDREYHVQGIRRDGTVRDLVVMGRNTTYRGEVARVATVRDVTEEKRAEAERTKFQEQLQQAQRIEAVGRLAGFVAHDLNNVLAAVRLNASLAAMDRGDEGELPELVQGILDASSRGAELINQLLAYSKRKVIQPKALDLGQLLQKLERMLARICGEHIELRVVAQGQPLHVRADGGQLEQAILNLVINARDAMPDGGRLLLETSSVELGQDACAAHPGIVPGHYVALSVVDTGCGIEKELQDQVFEPFFTTKPPGKGTGLGLASVRGIVEQNGGFIELDSASGEGTAFRLFFPAIVADVTARPRGAAPRSTGGTETVLVVEDEDAVRQMTAKALRRIGYKVLTACTGNEALAVAGAQEGIIDLLLSDVIMPGMDADELARRLREKQSGLKVLYTSGYAHDTLGTKGVLDESVAFIPKPFDVEELARKVRDALDGAHSANAHTQRD